MDTKNPSLDKVKVRAAVPEDLEIVAKIEKEVFSEPWSLDGFKQALSSSDNVVLVISDETDIYGYLVLYTSMDEGELMTIAVRPGFRGYGLADKLVKAMVEEGRRRGLVNIFLEVRKTNEAARSLYRKNGFIAVGERKNFYRFPTEDAIIGRLSL
jgi:ribosomal-protein-alanine N-acetyltransferase